MGLGSLLSGGWDCVELRRCGLRDGGDEEVKWWVGGRLGKEGCFWAWVEVVVG